MTAEPRVAYIMSRFPKITETFVLFEMKALEDRGARVEVFPLLREGDGPRHAEAAPYEARAHYTGLMSAAVVGANLRRFFRDPGRYLAAWWEAVRGTWPNARFVAGAIAYFPKCVLFAERMDALGVDHVHAHFATHPALAALIVHRLTGIPFSFTAHGSDLHVERRMLPAKVAAASFVVAVSEYNRRLILDECGAGAPAHVVVIHCGADASAFGPRTTSSKNGYHARTPSMRVACVASLEEVKGHRYLIDACGTFRDRGVTVRVDLVGDGSLRPDLEGRVAELGLGDLVRFHGALPRDEVRRVLASSDVAVLASYPTRSGRREGIPVALMEAMMSGLPVVASALSGIPELVEDGRTGYLVPPGDPWSLADRLQDLAAAPAERRRMGAAARSRVLRDFDLSRGAERLLGHIRQAARASHGCDG